MTRGTLEHRAFLREAGRKGGQANVANNGRDHLARIGLKGGLTLRERGKAYYRLIVPKRAVVLTDCISGKQQRFVSIAEAARFMDLNYATAWHMIRRKHKNGRVYRLDYA